MKTNGINFYKKRRMIRMQLVAAIYKYELENEKININSIFENDELNILFTKKELFKSKKDLEEQLKILSILDKNYDKLKKIIISYIDSSWTWNRLPALLRSILLISLIELWKLDKNIVINEYIEMSKDFIPNDNCYKFVNKVLESIGIEYEKTKQTN